MPELFCFCRDVLEDGGPKDKPLHGFSMNVQMCNKASLVTFECHRIIWYFKHMLYTVSSVAMARIVAMLLNIY